jgi:hypothetical protein
VSVNWAGEELAVTHPWKLPVETAKTTMEVGCWHVQALGNSGDQRHRGRWTSSTSYPLRGATGQAKNYICGLRSEHISLVVLVIKINEYK